MLNFLSFIPGVFAFILPKMALAETTIPAHIITLPDSAVTDIFTIVGTLFSDYWPITLIVTGVFLGVLLIEVAIHALRPK
jgi:hypothetical protein